MFDSCSESLRGRAGLPIFAKGRWREIKLPHRVSAAYRGDLEIVRNENPSEGRAFSDCSYAGR
jgi:hypothetical protein